MDDLKREVQEDAELQEAMRQLVELLSRADLDQLSQLAERNDLEGMAKALDLTSVDQLRALDSFLTRKAQDYKRYPDLERFARRRGR